MHRRVPTIAIAAAALLALPAPATAAGPLNVGLQADGGVGPQNRLRDPNPQITLDHDGEYRYTIVTNGPDNRAAHAARLCALGADGRTTIPVAYRGDGTYSGVANLYEDEDDDKSCEKSSGATLFSFRVSASAGIGAPSATLLQRPADRFTPITHDFRLAYTPGALGHDVVFGRNLQVSASGFSGSDGAANQIPAQGKAQIAFPAPGSYLVAARSKGANPFLASRVLGSPWSSVRVTVKAPFDIRRVRFADGRGPSYRVTAYVRHRTARGRVRIAIARGRTSRRFRSLGSVRFRKGRISKRFRARKTGYYRLRYRYFGSNSVAAGSSIATIRIAPARRR